MFNSDHLRLRRLRGGKDHSSSSFPHPLFLFRKIISFPDNQSTSPQKEELGHGRQTSVDPQNPRQDPHAEISGPKFFRYRLPTKPELLRPFRRLHRESVQQAVRTASLELTALKQTGRGLNSGKLVVVSISKRTEQLEAVERLPPEMECASQRERQLTRSVALAKVAL